MTNIKNWVFAGLVVTLTGFSMGSHAATGGESQKSVSFILQNGDGSIVFGLQSPSSSLTTNCYLGLITIPAATDAAVKSTWLTMLIAAKTTQATISLGYTYPPCVVTSISF